jgi:flagellar biosynthesis/type III secretory pathway protein FliH
MIHDKESLENEIEVASPPIEIQKTAEAPPVSFKFRELEETPLPQVQTTAAQEIQPTVEAPQGSVFSESDREALLQQGIEEGLRIAAEKYGTEQSSTLNSLNAICKEVFQNKKNLFHHMQENFVHLASSIAESIVGKELHLHPEKLATLIHQAIDASIHEETFTISVSPEVHKALMALEDFQYRNCLVAKEGFAFGQFKVESATTTLESDIRKIVSELIAQSDIHVSDSIEKPT